MQRRAGRLLSKLVKRSDSATSKKKEGLPFFKRKTKKETDTKSEKRPSKTSTPIHDIHVVPLSRLSSSSTTSEASTSNTAKGMSVFEDLPSPFYNEHAVNRCMDAVFGRLPTRFADFLWWQCHSYPNLCFGLVSGVLVNLLFFILLRWQADTGRVAWVLYVALMVHVMYWVVKTFLPVLAAGTPALCGCLKERGVERQLRGMTRAKAVREISLSQRFQEALVANKALIVFTLNNTLCAYAIRVMTETVLRESAFHYRGSTLLVTTALIVLVASAVASAAPEHINLLRVVVVLLLTLIVMDRMQQNDFLVAIIALAHRSCLSVAEEAVRWAFLLLGDLVFQLFLARVVAQVALLGLVVSISNFLGLYRALGGASEASGVSVDPSAALAVIQGVAIFVHPLLALYLSVPVAPHLSPAEAHALLSTLLAAPVTPLDPGLRHELPERALVTMTVVTLPAVRAVIYLSFPVSRLRTARVTEYRPLPAFNGFMAFAGSVHRTVSCAVAFVTTAPLLLNLGTLFVGWCVHFVYPFPPVYFRPEVMLGCLFSPLAYALGFQRSVSFSKVTELIGKKLVYGHQRPMRELNALINSYILAECFRNHPNVSVTFTQTWYSYRVDSWMGGDAKVFTVPSPLDGHCTVMLMYLLPNCLSLTAVAMYLGVYWALVERKARRKLVDVLVRSFFTAFSSILVVTILSGLYYIPLKDPVCKLQNSPPAKTCKRLIEMYAITDQIFDLCVLIDGKIASQSTA